MTTTKLPAYTDEGAGQKSGIGIGKASAQPMESDKRTWDGFGKFNNIPVNPDAHISETPKMTPEELLREKFIVLRKLEALEKKGAKVIKKVLYGLASCRNEGGIRNGHR